VGGPVCPPPTHPINYWFHLDHGQQHVLALSRVHFAKLRFIVFFWSFTFSAFLFLCSTRRHACTRADRDLYISLRPSILPDSSMTLFGCIFCRKMTQ